MAFFLNKQTNKKTLYLKIRSHELSKLAYKPSVLPWQTSECGDYRSAPSGQASIPSHDSADKISEARTHWREGYCMHLPCGDKKVVPRVALYLHRMLEAMSLPKLGRHTGYLPAREPTAQARARLVVGAGRKGSSQFLATYTESYVVTLCV